MPLLRNDQPLFYCFLIRLCNLFKNYSVTGDSFSPPPFPGKDANDISSDDDSGDSNVDMFASKKNVKHSTSTSFAKSHNYDDDSDDNDDLYENAKPWRASDIGNHFARRNEKQL